jgi:hypothetical protein
LHLPAGSLDARADGVLDLDWTGDVGRVVVDGRIVDDRFWDGTRWSLSLRDVGATDTSEIVVEVLALSPTSTIALAAGAEARRTDAATTTLRASVRLRGGWQRVD